MIGRTISHYKILSQLGEGGMGVVYQAEDAKLERTVALKFLAPHLVQDREVRRRFEREAKAAASLDHPNVCTVYEIDEAEGKTFIAMAYVEGESLDQKIALGPLKLEEALDIAQQIAKGLEAAHKKGIGHRDIKPQNIMVGPNGHVTIMDFGLAQLAEASRLTRTDETVGTTAYMSPEQTQGSGTDHRTDIWSLGVVLYEMVTGLQPFQGHYDQAVMYSILNEEPEPITALRTGVPMLLEDHIGKALAKEPEDRYQHVGDLIVDLRASQKRLESGHSRTLGAVEAPARQDDAASDASSGAQKRTRWPLWVAMATALAATAAWYLKAPRGSDDATPLVAVPFTSYDGAEFNPTFSPDGSQIAFIWDGGTEGRQELYTKSIGAEEPLKITSHAGKVYTAAWSPSGHAIAYMLQTSEGRYELRIVPPAGGVDQLVAELGPPGEVYFSVRGFATPLAWTPDSKFLAVPATTEPGQAQAIFLIDVNSREKLQLTFPEAKISGDSHPRFSHTGNRLAFVRGVDGLFTTSQLYILDLDEAMTPVGDPRHIQVHAEQPFSPVLGPAWTHDDSEIVVGVQDGLRRLASDGDGAATSLRLGSNSGMGSLSPDGRKLAFHLFRLDWDILQVDRRNGRASPLITSTLADFAASFSPNGTRIAWTSYRSGFAEIWVCRADGTGAVQLTSLEQRSGTAVWSPDGTMIAFDSQAGGAGAIFLINAEGGPPQALTSDPANDITPAWSPNGKEIYFSSNRDGEYRIWSMGVEGGDASRVSDSTGRFPEVRAGGELLYFWSASASGEGSQLLRKRLPDGPESVVIEEVGSWTSGETGLYFTSDGASTTIRRLDFDSGRVTDVFEANSPIFQINVSPDEQTILFGQTDNQVDIMLVENFR